MRILHVVAGAATGGAETFSQDAIIALAERGVEQRVLCRPHPIPLERFAAAKIPIETMTFAPWRRYFGAPARIARAAADFGADIVHAWMARAASFIPAAMPCPVIGWFGGYYDLKYYRHADSFVAVTRDIAATLIAAGAPEDRVFVNTTFGTLPDSPPVRRSDLSTPDDATVVLVLSRMHWKKGIDTILNAVATLPGIYLWLAGEGPEKAKFEGLAARLGLRDRVRFLGWRTDRKSLLAACDICALPSRYEPFGTVIIEAWAMGKPLVATDAAGARQYVKNGDNGLLCPIDDVAALAAAIRRIAEDPPLRDRLVAGGARDYATDFAKDVVVDRLLATYGKVMELGRRKSGA